MARAVPAGGRWVVGGAGVGARGCGAMVEGLTGPISGTFGTAAPYGQTKIWVCAGGDGWSDGLQDLMA